MEQYADRHINKIKEQSVFLIILLSVMGVIMLLYSGAAMLGARELKTHPSQGSSVTAFADSADEVASADSLSPTSLMSITVMYEKFFNGLFCAAVLFTAVSLFVVIKKKGTPFLDGVIKRLYIISGTIMAGALLSPVFAIALTYFTVGRVSSRINFAGFASSLVLSLVVLSLVRIFRYGTLLQQESDETL